MKKIFQMTAQNNIAYLYHMTHIENIENIFKYDLKSHNNKHKKVDISNKEVNNRRETTEPIYGHKIHDYVPFYFNPRNAMMWVRQNENIVILAFDKNLFLKNIDKKVIFTNQNAATNNVKFYKNLENLNNLDWNYIKANTWNIPTKKSEIKQKMMAEILIYKKVEIKYIKKIYVKNTKMKEELLKNEWIKKYCSHSDIIVNPYLFFKN